MCLTRGVHKFRSQEWNCICDFLARGAIICFSKWHLFHGDSWLINWPLKCVDASKISVYFRQVENRKLSMMSTGYQWAAVTLIQCKIFLSFIFNYIEITARYRGHIFRRHFLPVISISLWECRQYLQNRILQRVVKFVNKFEASVRVC